MNIPRYARAMTEPRWQTTTVLRAFCFSFNWEVKTQSWNYVLARFHFQRSANAHLGHVYLKLANTVSISLYADSLKLS